MSLRVEMRASVCELLGLGGVGRTRDESGVSKSVCSAALAGA